MLDQLVDAPQPQDADRAEQCRSGTGGDQHHDEIVVRAARRATRAARGAQEDSSGRRTAIRVPSGIDSEPDSSPASEPNANAIIDGV